LHSVRAVAVKQEGHDVRRRVEVFVARPFVTTTVVLHELHDLVAVHTAAGPHLVREGAVGKSLLRAGCAVGTLGPRCHVVGDCGEAQEWVAGPRDKEVEFAVDIDDTNAAAGIAVHLVAQGEATGVARAELNNAGDRRRCCEDIGSVAGQDFRHEGTVAETRRVGTLRVDAQLR